MNDKPSEHRVKLGCLEFAIALLCTILLGFLVLILYFTFAPNQGLEKIYYEPPPRYYVPPPAQASQPVYERSDESSEEKSESSESDNDLNEILMDVVREFENLLSSGKLYDSKSSSEESDEPECSDNIRLSSTRTACLIQQAVTPEEAVKICEQKNMRLLNISGVNELVFEVTSNIFGTNGGTSIWIDGKWNSELNSWTSWHDDAVLMNAELLGDEGRCLRIYNTVEYGFRVLFASCELKSYFYCEEERKDYYGNK